MNLSAIALNCTLKRDAGPPSSTDRMIGVIGQEFAKRHVRLSETIRVVDYDIFPGVRSNEGKGDAWPVLRERILAADILIFGTPIWLGQMSSVAKRVLERMDAFFDETDEAGRMPSFGKVAVAAIVGNEDGAHSITASLFQALNDVGWTLPAGGACYWVGEAMQSTDFIDLKAMPKTVSGTAAMLASNASHLARLLKQQNYPGVAQE